MSETSKPRHVEFEVRPHERVPLPLIQAGISQLTDHPDEGYSVTFLVDLSDRQDLVGIIDAHRTSEGECHTVWGQPPDDTRSFMLLLSFKKPVQAEAVLSFDIVRHGTIVDCLIDGKGVIGLVPGAKGENLQQATREARPSIRIPVSAQVKSEDWEALWSSTVAAELEISSEQARVLVNSWRQETRLRVAFPDMPPTDQLAGLFVDEDSKRLVFITNNLLTNWIRRDGPKTAESFDRFFGKEVEDLSRDFSTLSAAALPALQQAARSGDRLVWVCGQLIANSLDSIVAALELIRLGHRLQPGALLRTAIEGVATTAHLYHKPADLGRFLAGKLASSDTVTGAKAVMPLLGAFYGFLSKEFTHLGELHRRIQPSRGYESAEDDAAKTNLMAVHLALIHVWIIAELVFFDSMSKHRYWKQVAPGQYSFEVRTRMRRRMDEIAKRLSLDN